MLNGKQKIILELDEVNNLDFEFSIKGSSTSPDKLSTIIRFCIEDKETKISYLFPTKKKENNTVSVLIPKGILSESKQYEGKLEVLVGNRYFAPLVVDIELNKTLKVEAKIRKPEQKIDVENLTFLYKKPQEVKKQAVANKKPQSKNFAEMVQ